ncbi:hypothetical protein [Anaeromyxobacter oryzae]|uniref:Uncharacterized protein n=1 Tax=Anaeromyxobacter oryzae TaxID=2918170 RepID=A0ABM7X343_9BACT|nr:hypothetical protein [Anaeromyxobacter oryzae]BDG06212.1 hypothetical protein AMOR_52080 [Anaeromyxobacter oryzae]
MFTPEPSLTHVPALREQVVAIVESINQPQVSIPGKPSQGVSGHLCGIRNGSGSFSIFVGLHLPKSGENVIYLHERRQLTTAEEYRQVEIEGLQFLESMGFMLDNLNFRNLSPAAQDETLARIPLFSPPRPAAAAAAAPGPASADPARVARLLASF